MRKISVVYKPIVFFYSSPNVQRHQGTPKIAGKPAEARKRQVRRPLRVSDVMALLTP